MTMTRVNWILTMLFISVVFTAAPALAEEAEIGKAAPGFEMADETGKTHTLEDFKGKIVVLDFCSQKCPYSRGADPELSKLAKKYAEKEVVFIGVDSHRSTTPEEIKQYKSETGKWYPILKDTGNKYADKMGAQRTPEIYIIDQEGVLVYHGGFAPSSNWKEKGEKDFISATLDALLAGEEVPQPKTAAWGCTIKRAS